MPDRNLISVFSIHSFFPNELCNEVLFPKDLIAEFTQMMHLMIVYRNEYDPVRFEQSTRHQQTAVHHI